MTLGKKQELFAELYPQLVTFARNLGILQGVTVRLGDVFRDPRVHGEYGQKVGYASAYSLHKLKLAGDIYLIKDGRLLREVEDYEQLGRFWIPLHSFCEWGGEHGRKDGNHFSVGHDGRW